MSGITEFLSVFESLESTQLNLGLYTARVTAKDMRRTITKRRGK